MHVNVTAGARCRASTIMTLESGKKYEASILPLPYICGVFINELIGEKKGELIKTKSYKESCVK